MNEFDSHPEEPAETAEFWRLAQAYCNGTHSAQERERLEAILWDHGHLRKRFLDYAALHAELRAQACCFDSPSIPPELAAPLDLSGAGQDAQALQAVSPGSTMSPGSTVSPSDLPTPASEAGPLPQTGSIPAITSSPDDPLSGLLFPPATSSPLGGQVSDKLGGLLGAVSSLFHPPMVFFTLLTAVLCSVLASYLFLLPDRASREAAIAVKPSMEIRPVAYLTSANGCAWGNPTRNLWQHGRNVQVGDELTLHEGIAEFHLASGVALSVEGPAALVLNSSSSVVVHHGKITVYVPWSVADFKLLAGTCPITACDAGFGVDVAGSTVDLHVFSGEAIIGSSLFNSFDANEWEYAVTTVPAQPEKSIPNGSEFTKALVTKGRGLKLTGTSGMMKVSKWHVAKASQFASKLSMAGSLPVTDSYVHAVLKTKPVGYWRFESQEEGRIVNQVSPSNDLLIVGDARLIGNEENRAVEFGRSDSEGHLVSSKPLNALAGSDYSIEFWMKPSHSHRGGLLFLTVNPHTDAARVEPENLHALTLEVMGAVINPTGNFAARGLKIPDSIRFLHRDPPGNSIKQGTSCFSDTPYAFRRWQHLVATKKGSEMRLYLDGKLTAKGNDSTSLTRDLYLEVGRFIGNREIISYVGQLDELSIYNRALSEQVVKKHYKAMDWDVKPQPAEIGGKIY